MQLNLASLIPRPDFIGKFQNWDSVRGNRIAITGHRGVLGSLISERMAGAGISVATYAGDINDSEAISGWIQAIKPDCLFHLAAMVPLKSVLADPVQAMRTNATALLPIAEAIGRYMPECWLFLGSTSHVYKASESRRDTHPIAEMSPTNPISLYGATKLAGECILAPLAEHFHIPLCTGRIFSYFHERQSPDFLVPRLIQKIRSSNHGTTVTVSDSQAIRDFLHADMVVDAILSLYANRSIGTVNIGSGIATSVGEMADRVASCYRKDVIIDKQPSDKFSALVADIEKLASLIQQSSVK